MRIEDRFFNVSMYVELLLYLLECRRVIAILVLFYFLKQSFDLAMVLLEQADGILAASGEYSTNCLNSGCDHSLAVRLWSPPRRRRSSTTRARGFFGCCRTL